MTKQQCTKTNKDEKTKAMRKTKIKLLVLGLVLLGLGGCHKHFKCYSFTSEYVVCVLGTDTVRYFAAGFTDQMQRTKAHYESLGYTCYVIPNYLVGHSDSPSVSETDAKYLESQGYTCYQVQY